MSFDSNKALNNTMLCGAIELMRAEDTPEHRKLFLDEMLKGNFLSPAVVTPPPTPNESGRATLTPDSKVQFPMLTNPDGKQFFMAYTDWDELKKWKNDEKQPVLVMGFQDYAKMLLTKDPQGNMNPAAGFVINPFSSNVVIPKELMAQVIAAKRQFGEIPLPPKN